MPPDERRGQDDRRSDDRAAAALQGHDQYLGSHALLVGELRQEIGKVSGAQKLTEQALKSLNWEIRAAWGILGTIAGFLLAAAAHAVGIPI